MYKLKKGFTVCVCGGGSLAHAVSGVIGSNPNCSVNVLTRRPYDWETKISIDFQGDFILHGQLNKISDKAKDVVPNSDLIIIAVPHVAREEVLTKIKPYVKAGAWVGSFPGFAGFAWQAMDILGKNVNLFGLQRVPYVRGQKVYGRKVEIKGIRSRNFIASVPSKKVNEIAGLLHQIMNLYLIPVPNYLNICFSRSNSVCHPARIYSLLSKWDKKSPISNKQIKFYGDWDNHASRLFLGLDKEINLAISKIPIDIGCAEPVLRYYEIAFESDLTRKMKNIRAMNKNYIPLIPVTNGYVPDLNSYYFTEDICYGLIVLKAIISLTNTPTPLIDEIIEWGQGISGHEYVSGGELKGKDINFIPIPQNYGLNTLDKLIHFCSL